MLHQRFGFLKIILLFSLLLMSLPVLAVSKGKRAEIRINPEAIVNKEQFKLEEIATITGDDPIFVQKLSQSLMGRSPLPGRSLRLSAGIIKSRLARFYKNNRIELIVPPKALVSRAALKIDQKEIKKLVKDEVLKEFQSYLGVEVTIKSAVRDIFIPKGEPSFKIERVSSNNRHNGGYISWNFEIFVDGKRAKQFWVRTKVTIIEVALAAKHFIKRGTKITANDLLEIKKDVSRDTKGSRLHKDDLIGKVARRDIFVNEPLDINLFDSPFVIKEGSYVQLIYKNKNLFLSNSVQAMKSGRLGEIIPVKTMKNKKIIYAEVLNENRVQILL